MATNETAFAFIFAGVNCDAARFAAVAACFGADVVACEVLFAGCLALCLEGGFVAGHILGVPAGEVAGDRDPAVCGAWLAAFVFTDVSALEGMLAGLAASQRCDRDGALRSAGVPAWEGALHNNVARSAVGLAQLLALMRAVARRNAVRTDPPTLLIAHTNRVVVVVAVAHLLAFVSTLQTHLAYFVTTTSWGVVHKVPVRLNRRRQPMPLALNAEMWSHDATFLCVVVLW